MTDAIGIAEAELQNAYNFNPGKYSSNFIKERGPKLKEYYMVDGKNPNVRKIF